MPPMGENQIVIERKVQLNTRHPIETRAEANKELAGERQRFADRPAATKQN